MMRHVRPFACRSLSAVAFLSIFALPAQAQLQFASPDGKQSFKIGLLGQFQAEALDSATQSVKSKNLFIRRFRILGQAKISEKLGVFFETDVPNVGRGNADGSKNIQDVFIQDVHATYARNDQFNVDIGLLLLALSYNHEQSAASMMSLEYGPYTFLASGPTTARTGRDYGLRIRGLLAKKLEYRLAVVQGFRGVEQQNPFRVQGRVAYDPFGAQPGFFYRGTSLGKIKTLALGANGDFQKSYKSYGGDVYLDYPVAGGDGFTAQANFTRVDGGTFLTALPKQNNLFAEAGYYLHKAKLLPYVQYAKQDFSSSTLVDEQRPQVGIGYYFIGHNSNVKAAYTRIDRKTGKDRNQFQVQYQVFVF
jgi:hypothetical protein